MGFLCCGVPANAHTPPDAEAPGGVLSPKFTQYSCDPTTSLHVPEDLRPIALHVHDDPAARRCLVEAA
jgi:hypothetical protein